MVDSYKKLIFLELWISHILPVGLVATAWRKSEARDMYVCHQLSIPKFSTIVIERFEGFSIAQRYCPI